MIESHVKRIILGRNNESRGTRIPANAGAGKNT